RFPAPAPPVCHRDWNVVPGATSNPLPAVLGHEGAGVVTAVGAGVDSLAEGDHVVLSWLPACGRCFYSAQGRRALPRGVLRISQNGAPPCHYSYLSAFAESCIVPEGCCVRVREDAPFEVA